MPVACVQAYASTPLMLTTQLFYLATLVMVPLLVSAAVRELITSPFFCFYLCIALYSVVQQTCPSQDLAGEWAVLLQMCG